MACMRMVCSRSALAAQLRRNPGHAEHRQASRLPRGAGRTPKTAILAIILVSYFMILLDNSIVFTGLPRIQDDLGLTTAGLSWVTDAYTLVFGGLLLPAHRDRARGRRAAPYSRIRPDARPIRPGRSAALDGGRGGMVFGIINSATAGWVVRSQLPRSSRVSRCWPGWCATRPASFSRSCRCGCSPAGNTAHQLGGSLGLAVLTAVGAGLGPGPVRRPEMIRR